jgi:chromosome partitioning protein
VITAILNQKGGVSKTTLSIHLATALALRGCRVLLVDADPQHSALDWQASREAEPLLPVVGLPTKDLHRQIKQHVGNYDHIIIDGPPRVNELARSAILAADVVLIPITPSPYDVWAAKEIVDLITEASIFKPNLKSAFVISRRIVNTAIGRDVVAALEEYPIPVMRAYVCQRVAFAESAATGSTVNELDPNGQAAKEINAVTDELLRMEGDAL